MPAHDVVTGLIRRLPPASFAYVMATGVISAGLAAPAAVLSLILWILAAGVWAVLTVMLVARAVMFPRELGADLGAPGRAFGFFTVVAGTAVVGIRFAAGGLYGWAWGFWIAAAALWIVLGYAVPWLVVLRDHRLGAPPVAPPASAPPPPAPQTPDLTASVDGAWFVWVVASQSIAVLAAMLTPRGDLLALAAVIAWGTGLGLYGVVGVAFAMRVLRYGIPVAHLGPASWVVMGALAISTLAGAHIVVLDDSSAVSSAIHPFASGAVMAMWGLATWLVPGLILMGIWRHVRRRVSLRYTTELWAMVFPLGVYSVASMTVGTGDGLALIGDVGRVWIWVAFAAWVLVMADAAIAALRRRPPPAASAATGSAPLPPA